MKTINVLVEVSILSERIALKWATTFKVLFINGYKI